MMNLRKPDRKGITFDYYKDIKFAATLNLILVAYIHPKDDHKYLRNYCKVEFSDMPFFIAF